jgi:hypothetical protein
VKEWLALAGLGTGLFTVALVGTLAVQGRLDEAGTRGIPWIGGLFAAAGPEDPAPAPEGDADGFASEPGAPAAAAAEPPPEETGADGGGLFRFPQLDSGFTAEDLERVLRAAREVEAEAARERARLEVQEADLLARERDLEDRVSSIAEQMLRVDQERERLERRIAEFEQKVLLVERDELRGLREYGRTLASFEPVRAAGLVLEEWASDEGRKRIVKVLAVMDPDEADAILAAIDAGQVREVLLQRLRIVHEPSGR